MLECRPEGFPLQLLDYKTRTKLLRYLDVFIRYRTFPPKYRPKYSRNVIIFMSANPPDQKRSSHKIPLPIFSDSPIFYQLRKSFFRCKVKCPENPKRRVFTLPTMQRASFLPKYIDSMGLKTSRKKISLRTWCHRF